MLKKLQQKWKVTGMDFFFIILTFAVTGTFTAWMTRGITGWLQTERYSLAYWLLKTGMLLIGYQVFILFFGFCFGRFSFFWNYEKKILQRLGILKRKEKIISIAIFASGAGSNAEKIISYFKSEPLIQIALVVCNRAKAGVINIAQNNNIPVLLINREDFETGTSYINELKKYKIDWIVLAGFLWKMPTAFTSIYAGRIINIHPALLPKYGGKGMYGQHVHAAVIQNKETESGITIHYADEIYDHGKIILQCKCTITEADTPDTLAKKIHALEHEWFASTIAAEIKKAKS